MKTSPDWVLNKEEISTGVWRVSTKHRLGSIIEKDGDDLDNLIKEIAKLSAEIFGSIV